MQSVYAYGAVAWPLTAGQRARLCGATTRMLKYVRGAGYSAHLSLADIYRSIPQATTMLAQRRLRIVGHTLRSSESHPLKLTLGWTPKWCTRKVGGPKTSLNDTILTDAGYDRSCGWTQLKDGAKIERFIHGSSYAQLNFNNPNAKLQNLLEVAHHLPTPTRILHRNTFV